MTKLALCALVAATPFASFADILVNQAQTNVNGFFSGSFSSGGGYYETTVADDFTLASASTVQQIQFTGASEGYDALDNSDFSGFQVTVYDANFGVLQDFNVSVSDLVPTLTGRANADGGLEYVYTLNTNFNLGAGSYRLAVGAEETSVGGGSAWTWSLGGSPAATNYDNTFNGAGWNTYTTFSDQAFTIVGTQAVPEPASMAALGLGVAAMLRRRKKA